MLNLKNTILTLTLVSGTAALANQDFTPKLIIKNTGTETLIFNKASHSFFDQLTMQNSKNLVRRTKNTMNCYDPKKIEATLSWLEIVLAPNESITLDTFPEFFGNEEIVYFSGAAYPKAFGERDDDDYFGPGAFSGVLYFIQTPREVARQRSRLVRPFIYPDTAQETQASKKDLIVSMTGYTSNHKQHLEIVEEQLIDRA